MLELKKGRPEDTTGRLEKEIKVYDFLDNLNIEYNRVDHEALMTMEACEEVNKIMNNCVCKNLLLRNNQKTMFYMLMMPEDKKFKTKELSSQIGTARLSFAEPEFLEEFLNITPGSLSVMGLMNDTNNKVNLIIDEDLLKNETVGVHPCINTSTLEIKVKDLTNKFLPKVKHHYVVVSLKGEE